MKKLLKKIINWLEDWREDERLYKAEHPYPEYSHYKLEGVRLVFGWIGRWISKGFWWVIGQIKSRCE